MHSRLSALVLLVICSLVLANPPWCALQTDHHAEVAAGKQAVAEPSDDPAPHCSTRSDDTAVRAQSGDAPSPVVTGSTPPAWHTPPPDTRVAARASVVPVATRVPIQLCQLRI